ncbi:MAG TPA: (Fe-S)-binding protein [Polyangia bacterium]|nr:(Fe-S)-binding protein [Polyangia bacterium]
MSERAGERRGYFGKIAAAARTVSEGMAVTLAQYFRRPTTVQYPDRTRVPVVDSLPERYRGFLEVDMDLCTACKACERDCPIDVIAIDVEKRGEARVMTRFDIDMGKCMYCGICVESCPVPAQAPGDVEPTKCIRMTREFEGATSEFPSLTFRFVAPGNPVAAYKPQKGAVPPTPKRGVIARQVRRRAQSGNAIAFRWSLAQQAGGALAELTRTDAVLARADALATRLATLPTTSDDAAIAALLVDETLAKTDCGACGWPTCRAYAEAIASGRERALGKCEPGGAKSTRDVNLLVQLRLGKPPAEAAAHATAATLRRHR